MVTPKTDKGPWETESGLIDDVDASIANPCFGVKAEYAAAVIDTSGGEQRGLMFMFDLVDENGEVIGSQGYSIGSGWTVSDDGLSITHVKRQNVVGSTLYGQLQNRVVKELGVDMSQRGLPTEAMAWNNMGFHWMQQPHATVGGAEATGIMPTAYLGDRGQPAAAAPAPVAQAPAAPAPTAPAPLPAIPAPAAPAATPSQAAALKLVAETGTVKEFILKAVKVAEISGDDALMSQCLDDSAKGFYALNKAK